METDNETPTFEDFWILWPRKIARKDAARAWALLGADAQIAAIVGLAGWRRVWEIELQLREDRYDYLPYPATWLNGERWEDEIPARYRQSHRGPEFAADSSQGNENKGVVPMPDHVRRLLAKLRSAQVH